MSLTGIRKGIYDELYVTNGASLVQKIGAANYDDTQIQTDVTALETRCSNIELVNIQQDTAIASKQDVITRGFRSGTVQLLDAKPIWGSGLAYVVNQNNRMMIGVNSDSSKQDALSVAAPFQFQAAR